MFQPKEKFLDRVEQSFIIFKNNIVALSLPMLIFNVLTFVIFPVIFFPFLLGLIPAEPSFGGNESIGFIYEIYQIITIVLLVGLMAALVYIITFIPVQIGLMQSVKLIFKGEKVDTKKNLYYGASRLWDAFRTYWYIFAYTLLIPALIFIVGGVILNIGLYSNNEEVMFLGGGIIGLSILSCIFYAIYRGIKTSFAMISAVDSGNFTKENFLKAVSITNKKWWRIFGNIFGVSIFGGLLVGLLGGLGESIASLGYDSEIYEGLYGGNANISQMIGALGSFNIFSFINSVYQTFLSTLLGVFILVFTYVLFKRLEIESQGQKFANKNENIKDKIIEEL